VVAGTDWDIVTALENIYLAAIPGPPILGAKCKY